MSKYLKKKYINLNGQEQLGEFIFTFSIDNFSTFTLCGREGGEVSVRVKIHLFFFSKWSETSRKIFPICEGDVVGLGGSPPMRTKLVEIFKYF